VKKPRLYASVGVVSAVLLAVFFVPLPHSVMSSMEIQLRGAEPVYVDVVMGGRLAKVYVKTGDHVSKGQELALLENLDLDLKIAEKSGDREQHSMQLQNLLRQGLSDPRAVTQIPELQKSLDMLDRELENLKRDRDRLLLRAPAEGTVMPPPATNEHEDPEGQLPFWSGTPLNPWNTGAYLKEGVMFCQIGDPKKLEAVLVIDQSDIEDVHENQSVDIKLDELPHDTLNSRITEIAQSDLKISPQRLSAKAGGELATKTDPGSGVERPQSTSYQARAPLDDTDGLMRLGLRGRAKVHATWLPLGIRLWRLVTHTFNFKLSG
jgi:putative peptide zinc metalloprotease protein